MPQKPCHALSKVSLPISSPNSRGGWTGAPVTRSLIRVHAHRSAYHLFEEHRGGEQPDSSQPAETPFIRTCSAVLRRPRHSHRDDVILAVAIDQLAVRVNAGASGFLRNGDADRLLAALYPVSR